MINNYVLLFLLFKRKWLSTRCPALSAAINDNSPAITVEHIYASKLERKASRTTLANLRELAAYSGEVGSDDPLFAFREVGAIMLRHVFCMVRLYNKSRNLRQQICSTTHCTNFYGGHGATNIKRLGIIFIKRNLCDAIAAFYNLSTVLASG